MRPQIRPALQGVAGARNHDCRLHCCLLIVVFSTSARFAYPPVSTRRICGAATRRAAYQWRHPGDLRVVPVRAKRRLHGLLMYVLRGRATEVGQGEAGVSSVGASWLAWAGQRQCCWTPRSPIGIVTQAPMGVKRNLRDSCLWRGCQAPGKPPSSRRWGVSHLVSTERRQDTCTAASRRCGPRALTHGTRRALGPFTGGWCSCSLRPLPGPPVSWCDAQRGVRGAAKADAFLLDPMMQVIDDCPAPQKATHRTDTTITRDLLSWLSSGQRSSRGVLVVMVRPLPCRTRGVWLMIQSLVLRSGRRGRRAMGIVASVPCRSSECCGVLSVRAAPS